MRELGMEPAQTCVVGDAVLDVQMAVSAGVQCIGVSYGVAGGDELLRVGVDAVEDDFSALLVHFPPLQDHML